MDFEAVMARARQTADKVFDAIDQALDNVNDTETQDWYHSEYVHGLETDNVALEDEVHRLREVVKLLLDGEFSKTLTVPAEKLDFYADYDVEVVYTEDWKDFSTKIDIKLT